MNAGREFLLDIQNEKSFELELKTPTVHAKAIFSGNDIIVTNSGPKFDQKSHPINPLKARGVVDKRSREIKKLMAKNKKACFEQYESLILGLVH